jgi:hypothetical protein
LPLPHPSSQCRKDAAPDSGPKGTSTTGVGLRRRRGRGAYATQRKQGSEASARERKPPTAHRHSPAEPSAAISAATLVKLLIPLGYSKKKLVANFRHFAKHIFSNKNILSQIPLFQTIRHITSFFLLKLIIATFG